MIKSVKIEINIQYLTKLHDLGRASLFLSKRTNLKKS